MRINEIIREVRSNPSANTRIPLAQQISDIVKKHGGTLDDYWVSSTTVDRLGFYGGDKNHPKPEVTRPGKAFDIPTKAFSGQLKYHSPEFATYGGAEYSGSEKTQEKYGLWFMPLKASFHSLNQATYPYLRDFLFLVKLNDDAWLQPVNSLQKARANLIGIKPPAGKHKVGQYNSDSKIAVMFEPAFKIVGKWTKNEIINNARREQIGSPEMQKIVGQQRAADKKQLNKDLDNLF